MSDTTPTPRSDEESTPIADETAREFDTGERSLTTSSDPADHTDTGAVPDLPPDYRPVSASAHVAPEPDIPASEELETPPLAEEQREAPRLEAPTPTPPPLAEEHPSAPPLAEEQREAPPLEAPAPIPYAGPTYLQVPTEPKKRSNRGLGILIAVLAAVVFAVADLAATYGLLLIRYGEGHAADYFATYAKSWDFWLPLAVFTAAFIALVAIVNRGRWWGYVLGSIFVAVLVFAAYYGAALLTSRAWNFTPSEFRNFTHDYFLTNITYLWVATLVSVIALEVVIWFGAWVAFHGQAAKRKNLEARAAYEAELEATTSRR